MSGPIFPRIFSKYFPPTLKSIFASEELQYLGPHHFFIISGSVQAFQTSSTGASNSRSNVSCLSLIVVFPSDILVFSFCPQITNSANESKLDLLVFVPICD